MKRFGNLIGEIAGFENLRLAFYKAQRGKQGRQEVVEFRDNLEENLAGLSWQILSGDVSVGNYRHFMIFDPKKREICAAAFGERVLHHAIMNICHPIFERNLIYDTYATRIGKGVYSALDRARGGLARHSYVVKLDVRKYFDSVSHEILKHKLRHIFKDNVLLSIFDRIIDSYESSGGRGLPIGNLTSQYFANFYLSGLDHYAKEVLKLPVYVRYMDDILFFADGKADIIMALSHVVAYVEEQLDLKFKSPIVITTDQQLSFLGYRLGKHVIWLNGKSRKRFVHKMKVYHRLIDDEQWSEEMFFAHITPLLSFVEHAYTLQYRKNVMNILEGGKL